MKINRRTVYEICQAVALAVYTQKGWRSIGTEAVSVKTVEPYQVQKLVIEIEMVDRSTAAVTVKERAERCSRWYTRENKFNVDAKKG